MAGKTTSAGYRLPMATSSYHEKCIAASAKAIKDVSDKTSDKTYSHGAYRDCNVVAQERIWSEYVQKEFKQAKTWEKDWAFLTEVDYKGNPRPQKELYTREGVPLLRNYPTHNGQAVWIKTTEPKCQGNTASRNEYLL